MALQLALQRALPLGEDMPRSQDRRVRAVIAAGGAQAPTLSGRRASERYRGQVVVRFSLENSFDGLGLGYTGLAMTLIAVSVLVPRSASPLRSCPQLMRRP